MNSLKGITSFVTVAGAGSFASAAKLLGVSAVAVSKNVATLERQLGVRLLQRTTRKLSLTPEGESYYKQCLGPLRELEAASAVVQKNSKSLSGLVRVTCVAALATGYLLPIVERFQKGHPRMQIVLHLDDGVSDVVAQSYDVGIRVGQMKTSSMVARPIAPLPFVACAAPSYLQRHGAPSTLEDLAAHNGLRFSRVGSREPMPWFLAGSTPELDDTFKGNLTLNDFSALQAAAAKGLGIACIPLPLAMADIRQGRLAAVLPQLVHTRLLAYLYYPNRKNLPARVRSFVDFVLASLESEADLHTLPSQLLAGV